MLDDLTGRDFKEKVLFATQPVVVDFWANWCGPCRCMAPVVEEVAADFAGQVRFGRVNVDENGDITGRYRVMSISTLLFFKNGQVVERLIGYRPRKEVEEALRRLL